MKNTLLLSLFFFLSQSIFAQVPTEQDCLGAIPVCQDIYNQQNSYQGEGNYPNEINGANSCLGSGEENDVWYTFTVQTGGLLCFTISPNNGADDYDWAVYDLTNADCQDIYSDPSLEVSCNYDLTPGPTGANGNAGGQNEPCIPVAAGETFVLNVSNFSGSNFGYTLDFSASSAQIFDPNPPAIQGLALNSNPKCGDNTLSFSFNEDVLCNTVDLADFQITGPGGPYTLTSITGANCAAGANAEDDFTITFTPVIQSTGVFQLKLVGGSGFVEDQCGNVAVPGSVSFLVDPMNVTLVANPPTCPGGTNGTIQGNPSGGTPPFDFTWEDANGNIIRTKTGVNSDQIQNLPAGNYTVTINQGCATASVNLQNPPPFSANPNIQNDDCNKCVGSINTNVSGGTSPFSYQWNDGNSNPNRSNLCAGNYNVTVTDANGCDTTMYFTLINQNQPFPDAGPDDQVCGLTYNLQASLSGGTGQWFSSIPGVVFSNVSDPNATVTVPFSGTFVLDWTESINGCSVTDQVTITLFENPDADAGQDSDICQLYYQMLANPSVGQGTWTALTPGVAFTNPNDPGSFASVISGGSYTMEWKEDNNGCVDRDTVTITFYDLPPVNAGSNDSVCGLTYCLTGSAIPSGATGYWTSNDPSAVFQDANSASTCVSISNSNCARFTWNIDYGYCTTSDDVLVCFIDQPVAFAGSIDTTCALNYSLQAQPSYGAGTWTSLPPNATFSNPNDPNALATVPNFGDYDFIWTEDNSGCVDSDTVPIHFFQVPAYSAGIDDSTCTGSILLTGSQPGPNSTGTWQAYSSNGTPVNFNYTPSASSPNAQVSLGMRPFGCYEFVWEITYPYCIVADTAEHCFFEEPQANPGLTTDSICGLTYNLMATPSVNGSFIQWFSPDGNVSFANPNLANTQATAVGPGTYTLGYEESNSLCRDTSLVQITFLDAPISNAGADQNLCGLVTTLQAQTTSGSGSWEGPMGMVFSNKSGYQTQVDATGLGYGTYTLVRHDTNGICTDSDTLEVSFFEQPISMAGIDTTLCGNSLQLYANPSVGNGVWSSLQGGITIAQPTQANTIISTNTYGAYDLVWTETNGPCTDSDTVQIVFLQQPVSDPGTNLDFCGLLGQISANPSVGNGSWSSNSSQISFGNPTSAQTTISANAYGSYWVSWLEVNGICSDKDSIQIEFFEPTQPNAGPDSSLCGNTISLNASLAAGSGTWTITSGTGVFSDPNDPNSIFNPTGYGNFNLRWTTTNGACTDFDEVSITFHEIPQAEAGPNIEVCGLSANLEGVASVGQGKWYSPDGIIFLNPSSPITTVNAGNNTYGSYMLYWTETNGPCSSTDSLELIFYDNPLADFNCPDSVLYATNPVYQFQDNSNRAIQWQWDFGDGTSSTQQSPEHRYYDLGVFKVTLTVTDQFGCTGVAECLIEVKDDLRLFVPNAFSPNGDKVNDKFGAVVLGHRIGSLSMDIYDRWGKRVFSTDVEGEWWDGTMPDGSPAKPDVYAVYIRYEHLDGKKGDHRGTAILVR